MSDSIDLDSDDIVFERPVDGCKKFESLRLEAEMLDSAIG